MLKKALCLALAVLCVLGLLAGCGKDEKSSKPEETSIPAEPVTLKIVGAWDACKGIEAVGREFTKKYSNVTIEYEFLQNYFESLEKRVTGENAIDIFFTTNIQADSVTLPYALDIMTAEGIDLSDTFNGLIENFMFREEAGAKMTKLYALPLGAEMRGLYINKTLLDSLNIAVPTNQETLLAACKTLKDNGFIAFHGNPGSFGQMLLYPWICNSIANADDPQAAYDLVNSRGEGVSELLREPYAFMYTLIENGFYDYKTAQGLEFDLISEGEVKGLFSDSTDEASSRYFLNIRQNGDSFEKIDDVGQIAFMPAAMSLKSAVDKMKDDYHSNIEFVFVPAPIGKDGGFAYLSPAHGIAANKNSNNLEWTVKFLDFLFKPENNKIFAEEFNIIPNTKEAFAYIEEQFNVPNERITHLGKATFDYDFYGAITGSKKSLVEISKGNNPKYMKTGDDGSTSLYPLDYYLEKLENDIKGNE